MSTSEDVRRWLLEGAPALRGAFVHRLWREADDWFVLARHHVQDDPERPAQRRVVLEVGLSQAFARCVAVPPGLVDADDKKKKKVWARDSHPFVGLLRKHLVGAKIEALEQDPSERIVRLKCRRAPEAELAGAESLPLLPVLVIELLGRNGNLILAHEDDPSASGPVILGSLYAGKAHRPFDRGLPYSPPPRRDPKEPPKPTIAVEVAPDPETLALGSAVSSEMREAASEERQSSRQGELARAARKAIKRTKGIATKLAAQLADVATADRHEAEGDLIKANLGAIERGAGKVTLTDYSSGEAVEVTLQLDPTKDAVENMKARYKRAKKLRKGEASVLLRQGQTDAALEELRVLLAALESTEGVEEGEELDDEALDRLEEELRKRGALPKAKAQKLKQKVNQGPRSYRTLEGHEVLVGRSDLENDRLTMRTARGNDLFFHVAGCPGSHVILRVDMKRPPNHESLVDAAALAVHYSKARQRGKVDVHYTQRKYVRKPKGAKPGLVTISNFKMVRAGGDQERLKRLFETLNREGDA